VGSLSAPRRIQRRRTKGWRMPEGAVYVGRGKGDYGRYAIEIAVEQFREHLHPRSVRARDAEIQLGGRDLVCWCPLDQPCHADVLLDLANGGAA
jgi:hypothetical protein